MLIITSKKNQGKRELQQNFIANCNETCVRNQTSCDDIIKIRARKMQTDGKGMIWICQMSAVHARMTVFGVYRECEIFTEETSHTGNTSSAHTHLKRSQVLIFTALTQSKHKSYTVV